MYLKKIDLENIFICLYYIGGSLLMGISILQTSSFKKTIITTVSSIVLAGQFFSAGIQVQAAEVEDSIETYTYEINQRFEEYLLNFNNLTDQEIQEGIEEFQLFVDEINSVHTTIEPLELSVYSEEQLQLLIEYLNENRESIENNNEIEQSDELLVDQPIDESLSAFEANQEAYQFSVRSSSSTSLQPTGSVNRLQGAHRFATAVEVSKNGWNSSNTVVIANSHNFADALAGVPLAGALDAPILVSQQRILEPVTINEIQRLGATRAIILGGPDAISSNVENNLRNLGVSTERIAGSTRYETARQIGDRVRSITGSREAFVVNGESYPDALSVAAIAAQNGMPIYLTQQGSLSNQVRPIMNDVDYWVAAGGSHVISGNVTTVLNNSGARVRRLSGIDRYETNKAILDHYGVNANRLYVATGNDFVDALTGSVLAGKRNSAVALVQSDRDVLASLLDIAHTNNINQFTIFGGTAVVPNRVVESLQYMRVNGQRPLVFIDPGHGGHDRGPVYGGVSEAELNMWTSRYIRDELQATGNYDVALSRNSDIFIELTERANDANRRYADIFISVHYNAMGTGAARGIETFIHHPTYPAQETNRNNFRTSDPRIAGSLRLADAVHPMLINQTGLNNRGIKGLNLNVLRNTEMPAVLLELGFMDNSTELSIIRTASYQQRAARAVRDGVDRYFGVR